MQKDKTAAILIVGDEILTGRTRDSNSNFIALRLAKKHIELKEIRTIPDKKEIIISSIKSLKNHSYLFITGGIGPTPDDITAQAVAEAFNTTLVKDRLSDKMLSDYYKSKGKDYNDARQKMSLIPKGSLTIKNDLTIAPGFWIENVIVMAGVPEIMQSMFCSIEAKLTNGKEIFTNKINSTLPEGEIAHIIANYLKDNPNLKIGSYPHFKNNITETIELIITYDNKDELDKITESIKKDLIKILKS